MHVIATAGHVDHGKSSLILRLTGIDPDRWAEEKRRGMTIDLGFAWTTLPSGGEVGFVDVPGHERFVRNMLAGVGPVRLILFVVAADEGWKPQSEEHLQILDILGVSGAVVALTKTDVAGEHRAHGRADQIREKLRYTRLERARVVPCSALTGQGIDDLRSALDEMIATASPPQEQGRPRQFVDRAFTIRGAGTVLTGTLAGGSLSVGEEAEILPSRRRGRIRALQTHKRSVDKVFPVSRVAVNIAGIDKQDIARGDVLSVPGRWRPTSVFEGSIRAVRTLDHAITSRGAYKLYAGSAERDVTLRLYGQPRLSAGEEGFARLKANAPLVLDFRDPFVLRDAGRRSTVGGGFVLDLDPPVLPAADPVARLRKRRDADRTGAARLALLERGAMRASDLRVLTGVGGEHPARLGAVRLGNWLAAEDLVDRAAGAVASALEAHHSEHPLSPGMEIAEIRTLLGDAAPAMSGRGLVEQILLHLERRGMTVRQGTVVRLAGHAVRTAEREDARALLVEVAEAEPTPPTIRELEAAGFQRELVNALCAEGKLVRVSRDLVMTPSFVTHAEAVLRSSAGAGLTVSSFREALGTSRKYALPLLEYFDGKGVTRRQGDVRVLRG